MLNRRPLRAAAAATAIALCGVATVASPASAHVSIVTYGTTFTAGSTNVFYFRVPHGCPDPGLPNARTTAVEVNVPAAATSVKPQAIPGWDVVTEKDPVTLSVTKITWTARSVDDALHDWTYADFGVRATLNGAAGDKLLFPAKQYCDAHEDGTAATGLTEVWDGADAPNLTLVAAANKVANAADLADVKSRVIVLETKVSDALGDIGDLVTADTALDAKITTLTSSLGALSTKVDANAVAARQGWLTATHKSDGRVALLVDLATTSQNRLMDLYSGSTKVGQVRANSVGDVVLTLSAASSAKVKAGDVVKVSVSGRTLASGKAY
jgi:uncharacterized protein YcnI